MMQLLVPFARFEADTLAAAQVKLPFLESFLQTAQCTRTEVLDAYSYTPPHELFLAQSLGLPHLDGQIPWAGYEANNSAACAFITPCHWNVGVDSIQMSSSQDLQLTREESAQFMQAMQPYFTEDGIALSQHHETTWLATSPVFEHLKTASLDRVVGRNLNAWMPSGPGAAKISRLQNEMQMLLYTHPLNDERGARGLAPINSFWVHGAGRIPTEFQKHASAVSTNKTLRQAALAQDMSAWSSAWPVLDQELQSRGAEFELITCTETNYKVWQARPVSLKTRFLSIFGLSPSKSLDSLL
jgi:hypothetical protein